MAKALPLFIFIFWGWLPSYAHAEESIAPTPECNLETSEFQSILVDGNQLFLGVYDQEILCVFDVSVPEAPVFLSVLDYRPKPSSPITKMIKNGDFLYAGTEYRVHVIDVSDARAPRLLDSTMGPSPADFLLHDSKVFIGSGDNTKTIVRIYDVSDAAEPKKITEIVGPKQWAAEGIGFNQKGHLVFSTNDVGPRGYGYIYDITDLQAPKLLTTFERSRWGVDAAVTVGNYEVSGGPDGLMVFDHTNSPVIEVSTSVPSSVFVRDIRIGDDHILVHYSNGVTFYDIDKLPDLDSSKWVGVEQGYLRAFAIFDVARMFAIIDLKLQLLAIP